MPSKNIKENTAIDSPVAVCTMFRKKTLESGNTNERSERSESAIHDTQGHRLNDGESLEASEPQESAHGGAAQEESGSTHGREEHSPKGLVRYTGSSTQLVSMSNFNTENEPDVQCESSANEEERNMKNAKITEESSKGSEHGVSLSEHDVHSMEQEKADGSGDGRDAPDGGWGYMVAIGTFIIMTVVGIVGPGFGILFSDFLTGLGTSSTTTAAIYNTESFAWSISNLLAGPLTEHFGFRRVALAGGLFCSIGMAASSFAPSAEFLFFSHSVLSGFGSGSACLVSFAILPHYFDRLLGRANAVMSAGMSVGGMVGPPVVTFLQQKYGFRGATLIVSSLVFHMCFAATMYHPVEWHTKKKTGSNSLSTKKHDGGASAAGRRPGVCFMMSSIISTLVKNCKILRSLRVMIISLGGSFVIGVYLNFFMLVPFVMEAGGHTQEEAAWCMTVLSLCNLASRLLVSSLADLPRFNLRVCYILSGAVIAITTVVFCFVREVVWLMVVLGLWGCGVGASMSIYPLIMVRYLGRACYVPLLGVSGVMHGLWLICSGPFFGMIRDVSGSYTVSLCVLASTAVLTIIMWLLMPAAVACDKRRGIGLQPDV